MAGTFTIEGAYGPKLAVIIMQSLSVLTDPGADPGIEAAVVVNLETFAFASIASPCHPLTSDESDLAFSAIKSLSFDASFFIAVIS